MNRENEYQVQEESSGSCEALVPTSKRTAYIWRTCHHKAKHRVVFTWGVKHLCTRHKNLYIADTTLKSFVKIERIKCQR